MLEVYSSWGRIYPAKEKTFCIIVESWIVAVTLCCHEWYNCYETKFSHWYSLPICSRKDATSPVCGVFWVLGFHQLDKCVNRRRKETLVTFARHWFLSRIKEMFNERTGHDFCICVGQWTLGQDLLTRNSKGTADSALSSPYNYMEKATPTYCLGLSGHSRAFCF